MVKSFLLYKLSFKDTSKYISERYLNENVDIKDDLDRFSLRKSRFKFVNDNLILQIFDNLEWLYIQICMNCAASVIVLHLLEHLKVITARNNANVKLGEHVLESLS